MAWKGNGSSGFWSCALGGSGQFLFPARYTMFMHYRNAAVPSTANVRVAIGMGDSGTPTAQAGFCWNHTAGASNQAMHHRRSGSTYDFAQFTTALQANTWYRMGFRYNGTNISAWLNGTAEATTASADGNTASNVSFGILAYPGGAVPGNHDDGTVAEAALWDVALTDDEMTALGEGVCPLLINTDRLLHYVSCLGADQAEVNRGGFGNYGGGGITLQDHPPTIYYPSELDGDIQPSAAGPVTTSQLIERYGRGIGRGILRGAR
jgi:concanavalin A-like lectin/glucanase superfamily protein